MQTQLFGGHSACEKSWGEHAPSRVVFDALVENCVEWPETHVFGEGAKDNTRGACAPRGCFAAFPLAYSTKRPRSMNWPSPLSLEWTARVLLPFFSALFIASVAMIM